MKNRIEGLLAGLIVLTIMVSVCTVYDQSEKLKALSETIVEGH